MILLGDISTVKGEKNVRILELFQKKMEPDNVEHSACFTGHRAIPPEEESKIQLWLDKVVEQMYGRHGVRTFWAGGALGFDTLAAEAVLEFRRTHRDVKLFLALPCADQARYWREEDKRRYEALKVRADGVRVLQQRYDRQCMNRRNRYLVDHGTWCVAYLTAPGGGTAYTVAWAREQGKSVWLYPQTDADCSDTCGGEKALFSSNPP